jgi:hypothetical protein
VHFVEMGVGWQYLGSTVVVTTYYLFTSKKTVYCKLKWHLRHRQLHTWTTLAREVYKYLDTKLGLSIVALENESVEQRRYGNSLNRHNMLQSALLVYGITDSIRD